MTGGLPIGRVLGFEIRVHWTWIVVLAFVAVLAASQLAAAEPEIATPAQWALAAIVAIGFFLSALAHDLGHAVMARRRGIRMTGFAVSFFGGTTPLDPSGERPADEAAISVAGPLVSIVVGAVLGAIGYTVGTLGGSVLQTLGTLAIVLAALNVAIGGINLVPAYPLDGGRIVRAIAWWRSNDERRGTRVAARVGSLVGWTVVAGGLGLAIRGDTTNGLMLGLCGWFLTSSARGMLQRVQLQALTDGMRVDEVMERDVATVAPGLTVDTFAAQLLDGDSATTAVPVVQGDELIGLVGVAQVRRLRRNAWATTRVEDVMVARPRLPTLAPDEALWPAVERIRRAGVDGLPVVGSDAGLLGVLTRRAVALAIHARRVGETPTGATPDAG